MAYSYIIQKDLPLISWQLDDTGISSGNSIAQNGYLSIFPNTSTDTNGIFKTTCTNKKLSVVQGSAKSVYISENGTDSCAIQVPAMGFASNKFKRNPMTLEFWVKPKTTLSTDSMQKLVGKPNSETGVYIHNSSFIGIVGDTAGNTARVTIPVDNMSKPFHIAFVYQEDSVTLIVNGIGSTAQFKSDVVSSTSYNILTDVFRFYYFGNVYALDNVSIYAYPMSVLTARRHMVYGLGYQIPESLAGEFGGYRYNLSLAQTKLSSNIQKYNATTWMSRSEINNLAIENNHLRINKYDEPLRKHSSNTTDSIFSFDSTKGLKITSDGGFIEIYPQRYGSYVRTGPNDTTPYGNGFAFIFNKSTSENVSSGEIENLMILQDPIKEEYSVRIYLHGESGGAEAIYYQVNNESPVKLGSNISGGISGSFAIGYFYNIDTNEISVFQQVSGGTQAIDTFENESLFPISYSTRIRLMSNDNFDEYDDTSGLSEIERFSGGLLKVVQLDTNVSSVFSDINSRIDKYTAIANYSEKRFIIKATGWIKFKIDSKQLDGLNNIIGPNRIEWGHDSNEVSVTASPIGRTGLSEYATYSELDAAYSSYSQVDTAYSLFSQIYDVPDSAWFTEEEIINRTAIKNILGKSSNDTRAVLITINISSNDVVLNPTKISYFRLSSLYATEDNGVFTSKITCSGPDINLTFTTAKNSLYLPDYRDTPFLWTEESGGLRVSRTAKIDYDVAPTSGDDEDSGIVGISFMVNIPDSTARTILTVSDGTTSTVITTSANTMYATGGSFWVDGLANNSFTYGEWHQITVAFNARKLVTETSNVDIVFGSESGSADFYLDEITTLDGATGSISLSGDNLVSTIFHLYNGTYTNVVNSRTTTGSQYNELNFYDSEISNDTEIYQPMAVPVTQTALLVDVDLASYSNKTASGTTGNLTITYTGVLSMLIDGTYMQDGDRILLKNQATLAQNGIFTVTLNYDTVDDTKINTITLTRQSGVSTGSTVYVKDGVVNKGTHWTSTTTNVLWAKAPFMKKVDAYTFEGSADKTDIVAKATITI